MPRADKNSEINTRNKRREKPVRREPYWKVISKGCALGYRKASSGGSWIARYRDDAGKQHYQSIGASDDLIDSDGGGLVLSYGEAQQKADAWFKLAERGFEETAPQTGPYTVADALWDYVAAYDQKGGKSVAATQWVIDARILPDLGGITLNKLSSRRIETWRDALASSPRRMRTSKTKDAKPGVLSPATVETPKTPNEIRRRRSSANRILTILKAALNHSLKQNKIASDSAWRSVKPFREVDAARIRYLNDDEARRLVNATGPDFRPIVQAALLTGCRYGELAALKGSDFNPDTGTIFVRVSKAGKPRHIYLTDEGQRFFKQVSAGKTSDGVLIARADGGPWGKSHQHRPFKAALSAAKIENMAFHELRHSYASRLVMAGVPLNVVAAQLGHTDTRMVEKHYGHMSASYIADTVRGAFKDMGLVPDTNVATFATGAKA